MRPPRFRTRRYERGGYDHVQGALCPSERNGDRPQCEPAPVHAFPGQEAVPDENGLTMQLFPV